MDLTGKTFIPNGMFDEIMNLVAKDGEEKCEVGYSRSAYGSDKENISHKKNNEFKYPVIHSVNIKNESSFIFSNTKRNGMFGIPKVIFGRRTCGTFIDFNGEYGCSQDTSYLVSTRNNLESINQCLQSPKFIKLMSYGNWNQLLPIDIITDLYHFSAKIFGKNSSMNMERRKYEKN